MGQSEEFIRITREVNEILTEIEDEIQRLHDMTEGLESAAEQYAGYMNVDAAQLLRHARGTKLDLDAKMGDVVISLAALVPEDDPEMCNHPDENIVVQSISEKAEMEFCSKCGYPVEPDPNTRHWRLLE